MHLFTPNHVALVGACYPPWSSASPEYRPNPQELSRLTYYATNRPGKIHKLGLELEKHTRSESTKALAGHPRQRACVSSLSPSLHPHTRPAPSSSHSPSSVPSPSNVAATSPSFPPPSFPASNSPSISSPPTWRSLPVLPASCVPSPPPLTTPHPFQLTAWCTYTDGHAIGVDPDMTQNYLVVLGQFAKQSVAEIKSVDHELRNRSVSPSLSIPCPSPLQDSSRRPGCNYRRSQLGSFILLLHPVQVSGLPHHPRAPISYSPFRHKGPR